MKNRTGFAKRSDCSRALFLILMGAVGLSLLHSCGPLDGQQNPVAMVVGTQRLTLDELEQDLALATEELPISTEDIEQIKAELLEHIIDRYLILEYARRHNIVVSEKELETHLKNTKKGYTESLFEQVLLRKSVDPEAWKRRFKEQLIIEKVINSVASDVALPDYHEMKAYFESDPNRFKTSGEVRFRQIFCQTRKNANKLYARIRAGEDFAELAKHHSEGPEADTGGEVGWMAKGVLEKSLDKMLFSMSTGDLSPVTKGASGYHILEVMDRRPGGYRDFSKIMNEIERELLQKKQKAYCRKWLKSLRTDIKVKINQKAIDKLELS